LIQKHNIKVLITGTANELAANTKLVAEIGKGALLLPPMDIMSVAGVISKAKLVVCGNTGIMHLACALGVPVVALHGPTNAAKWGPRGDKCAAVRSELKCSPCLYLGFEYKCAYNRCMKKITVEEVINAAVKVAFSA
jgi:ADP-heptose:LPS heptosyltransferase